MASSDAFLVGEDFELIFDYLDEEDEIENAFDTTLDEIQPELLQCSVCGKTCKSKGGLTRHSRKHKDNQSGDDNVNDGNNDSSKQQCSNFTFEHMKDLLKETSCKLQANECYPTKLRDEFTSECCENLSEEVYGILIKSVKECAEVLQRSYPNPNKFYSKFYSGVVRHSSSYFTNFSCKAATLFATTLATVIYQDIIMPDSNQKNKNAVQKSLSEKELAGLQYLGGYIFSKLHKKLRSSKHWKTEKLQKSLSLLEAAKLPAVDETQKLVSCLNRGGLWFINTSAQNILIQCEHYFKRATEMKTHVRSINRNEVVQKCVSDVDILSNFEDISETATLKVEKNVAHDVLTSIIDLFIRVRSYTYAKDIVQRYKLKNKTKGKRSKALRKELNLHTTEPSQKQD